MGPESDDGGVRTLARPGQAAGWLEEVTWQRLVLAAVLGAAVWARLGALDLGWFMMDQARDAVEALKIVESGRLPLVGPIARDLYALGPLYYYLLAPAFWISKDPAVAVFLIGGLNLVAVYLTYRLGREFFSVTTGLVAAALYAVFPMAVISTRSMWNPGLVPFFTAVFVYATYRFMVGRRPWGLTAALAALACLLQVHLSSLALVLVFVTALLLFRPAVPWRHAALGAAIGLALFAPYIAFEAMRGFQGVSDALRFLGQDRGVTVVEPWPAVAVKALRAPFTIPVQIADSFAGGPRPPFFTLVQYAELALVLAGVAWILVVTPWRRPGRDVVQARTLLLLWMAVPLLVLVQKKQVLMWYYFDLLYPSQFLLAGLLVDAARGRAGGTRPVNQALLAGAGALVGLIACAQVVFLAGLGRDILGRGSLRLPTEISVRFPDPLWMIRERGVLELMPVHYKRRLTSAILGGAPTDLQGFFLRTHGAAFEDSAEDRGYFFSILQGAGTPSGADLHHAVIRERDWPDGLAGAAHRVGPFLVVPYRPLIRYASWRYASAPAPGWPAREFDDAAWTPAAVPARNLPDLSAYTQTPLRDWARGPVYLRGVLEAPAPVEGLHVVVSLRDFPPGAWRHQVGALHVNGQRLEPAWTRSYLTPLARATEAAFRVDRALTAGANVLAFEVSGTFPAFDLDVYEVRGRAR
jgi:hypothetical protein